MIFDRRSYYLGLESFSKSRLVSFSTIRWHHLNELLNHLGRCKSLEFLTTTDASDIRYDRFRESQVAAEPKKLSIPMVCQMSLM